MYYIPKIPLFKCYVELKYKMKYVHMTLPFEKFKTIQFIWVDSYVWKLLERTTQEYGFGFINSTTVWRATCRARGRDRERGESFKEQ